MIIKLNKGDQIDVLAPSSFIDKENNLTEGLEILKKWGLKIKKKQIFVKEVWLFCWR